MRLVGAPGKRLAYRAMERAGWVHGRPVKEYWARLRIDPRAPEGVSEIPGEPILTEHSRLVRQAAERRAAWLAHRRQIPLAISKDRYY